MTSPARVYEEAKPYDIHWDGVGGGWCQNGDTRSPAVDYATSGKTPQENANTLI